MLECLPSTWESWTEFQGFGFSLTQACCGHLESESGDGSPLSLSAFL